MVHVTGGSLAAAAAYVGQVDEWQELINGYGGVFSIEPVARGHGWTARRHTGARRRVLYGAQLDHLRARMDEDLDLNGPGAAPRHGDHPPG